MRSLMVGTILCLISTPGATCIDNVCSDKMRSGDQDDKAPTESEPAKAGRSATTMGIAAKDAVA